METPNSIVITKESNGNVTVKPSGQEFSLLPDSYLTKEIDAVIVRGKDGKTVNRFTVAAVEKLVNNAVSPNEVAINDVDTLFSELNEFFFFKSVGGSMPSNGLLSDQVIQNLVAGDNIINHNLDKIIVSFSVKDGNDFIIASGNIIDSNSFNINLAGGNINNATITFIYTD